MKNNYTPTSTSEVSSQVLIDEKSQNQPSPNSIVPPYEDSQKFVDLENGQRKNESPQEKPAKRPVSSDERTILLWMYALLFIFLGFTIIFMGSLTLNYYNMFQLCASDIMAFIVFFCYIFNAFLVCCRCPICVQTVSQTRVESIQRCF